MLIGLSAGTTVAGGMMAATFRNLAFIPVLYVVVKGMRRTRE
jgi:multidrug efflux pump subunit AcrB